MRRALALATALAALAIAPSALAPGPAVAQPVTLGNWDGHEQRVVAQAGLLADLPDGAFHGEQPLDGTQVRDALGALGAQFGVAGVADAPTGHVSVFAFDRLMVEQLGLLDVAETVQDEATRVGLRPPTVFGTEVVARMLLLRHDHPYGYDALELYPTQPITRAEAAWSLARAIDRLDDGGLDAVRAQLQRFVLPDYTPAQLRPLRIAVAKIGMPYVWGGETDGRSYGQQHGGYDCSGFSWRVFKLSGLPEGREIRGRTAASQAGEIPKAARVRASAVLPTDLVFFGPGRFWQTATERRITHMGIALSKDWMIQSGSSYGSGVSVAPLFTPDRAAEFSWARHL